MSSMRNATQRRNHRERGQPLEREARLGMLEKHKDYSLRSKNHNENKKRLKILRQKAAERNPDEFSYGMLSSQSRKGRKLADRQNPVLGQDVVKILKTQDAGYVTTMLQKTKRARAKLEQQFILSEDQGTEVLGALSSQGKGSHTVFVDDREAQRHYNSYGNFALQPERATRELENPSTFEKEEDSDGEPLVYLSKEQPKSRHTDERQELALKEDKLLRKQRRREQDARRSKLAALKAREKDLNEAENELDLQRAKMSNSVGGTTKVGLTWKMRERKK
ncbi:MAG: hypothetical protein ALECFALPRED_003838 [Alectoria fallacina]|uniref:U3 small nucleolar RNA-associated protein 11 n=1 Tax=Alectoria fallacina TaxID=1903189 RepID=A0A8H3IQK4_9LECA|nr:MAG: hypothetical protein ALECFALPRED_003838 [Alectoria fallacina]